MADEVETKVKDLMTRHASVLQRKAALSGQLQAKKEELVALVAEIKAAGYDPKNLSEECKKAKADLEVAVASFETDLIGVEKALAVFDKR